MDNVGPRYRHRHEVYDRYQGEEITLLASQTRNGVKFHARGTMNPPALVANPRSRLSSLSSLSRMVPRNLPPSCCSCYDADRIEFDGIHKWTE